MRRTLWGNVRRTRSMLLVVTGILTAVVTAFLRSGVVHRVGCAACGPVVAGDVKPQCPFCR